MRSQIRGWQRHSSAKLESAEFLDDTLPDILAGLHQLRQAQKNALNTTANMAMEAQAYNARAIRAIEKMQEALLVQESLDADDSKPTTKMCSS